MKYHEKHRKNVDKKNRHRKELKFSEFEDRFFHVKTAYKHRKYIKILKTSQKNQKKYRNFPEIGPDRTRINQDPLLISIRG